MSKKRPVFDQFLDAANKIGNTVYDSGIEMFVQAGHAMTTVHNFIRQKSLAIAATITTSAATDVSLEAMGVENVWAASIIGCAVGYMVDNMGNTPGSADQQEPEIPFQDKLTPQLAL